MSIIGPTRFSRVSVGWWTSSVSLADKDTADTGATFSVMGPSSMTGNADRWGDWTNVGSWLNTGDGTNTGTFLVTGATTLTGAVTQSSGEVKIGGGAGFTIISSATQDLDFGSVSPLESSQLTLALSGATRGDTIIVTPDSEWSGVDADLAIYGWSGDTTGEVNITAINSTLTAVDPAATVFRTTRIGWTLGPV